MESAAVLLASSAAANVLAVNVQAVMYPSSENLPPLRDLLHSSTPNLSRDENVAFVSLAMPVIVFVSGLLKLPNTRRIKLMQQLAVIVFVKSALIVLTALPPPRPGCKGFMLGPIRLGLCRDMNMSVHTALTALVCLHVSASAPNLRLMMLGVFLAVIAAIILARHHYSADIVLGAVVAGLVFGYFEANEFPAVRLPSIRSRRRGDSTATNAAAATAATASTSSSKPVSL